MPFLITKLPEKKYEINTNRKQLSNIKDSYFL